MSMTFEVNQACPRCGDQGPHAAERRTNGTHYADCRCAKCGQHWFPPKPETDVTKYKRPKSHAELVNKFSRGFCELCGFKSEELPRSETLHAHHVEAYAEGGEPTRENTWIVCTACHSLIEHQRTYRGKLRRVIVADLEAIKVAMLQPPTSETFEELVNRKRAEQGL